MFVSLKRIISAGFNGVKRNGLLSIATISIMALVLIIISGILVLGVVSETVVLNLENKVDISVYFRPDIKEETIFEIKNNLLQLPEVKEVVYVSKEEALEKFKERHKDDEVIMQSLEEIKENPLAPLLNIKAKQASSYEQISQFLEGDSFKPVIDKINFKQNKNIIDKINKVVYGIRKGVLIIGLTLATIVVLITFNAIRLTIYSLKEEISIMKLVGASNWFIRGPFIVEGIIYGLLSFGVATAIFYAVLYFISPSVERFFDGLNLFSYFINNFVIFSLLMLTISIILGVLSSSIAIRRYLK